ncbi:MAG: NTPase [Planctomycetota bacterium]
MDKVLLLTGAPGVGKTTVVRKIADALADREVRGFLTREMRSHGRRVGFRIESLSGEVATMAHVEFSSPHRVGRYGVDVDTIDRIVEEALVPESTTEMHLVDEIGKMECFSHRFVAAMRLLLEAGRPLIATVALRGSGFIAEVKRRPDVEIVEVTLRNRNDLPGEIASIVP